MDIRAEERFVWRNLTLNVIGGILAGWTFSIWRFAVRELTKGRFRQIFGSNAVAEGITLIYEEMTLPSHLGSHPYLKPGFETTGRFFSIARPIPIASVRAISYLSNAIGKVIERSPTIRSDTEVRNTLDLDFICFGGPFSNIMTETCFTNGGNRLVNFDQTSTQFKAKNDEQPLIKIDAKFDYGVILKLHPVQFPERVWIACAGIGERGTSAAAWYLANKWKELRHKTKDKPFAAFFRVEPDAHSGRDQSAELLKIIVLDGDNVGTTDFRS
jgi:hypothetical protein